MSSAGGDMPTGIRRRANAAGATASGGGGGASSGGGGRGATPAANRGSASGGLSLRLYSDDAPGLKVGPMTVIVSSLVYIVIVCLLHISNRLFGSS
ncbi:hypothetical protein BU14_0074s0058 [Porphyra umbilicalis]|uniref:Protein transport protein Sec61 subunit beta n=1 Tax=Porphyra umbilicalis TaxID=2786 RepID=A0A1X6PFL6_PORUM|nr:hypothetical protein BU14_0074s0058 [Porphyra umbilicalis]|eukprot:OSX79628.1 hypothetical protein BU14_0074s0058 [Porphyra umbilicalis]